MDEIEVTFLEIDLDDIRSKLEALGAKSLGAHQTKRKLFDFSGLPLEKNNSWLRLRDNGNKTTLTYKKWMEDGLMKETEVVVSDFDTIADILLAIGMIVKRYEENKREKWTLGDITFDIDSWPLIPTYIEIEGPSLDIIQEVSEKLGFDWNTRVPSSPLKIYASYGYTLGDYSVLTFDEQIKIEKNK